MTWLDSFFGAPSSSTTTKYPAEITNAVKGLVGNITNMAGQPYPEYTPDTAASYANYVPGLVAPMAPNEVAAGNTIAGLAGGTTPYFNAARDLVGSSANPMQMQQYSGNAINKYMNPYMNDVVSSAVANINQTNAQQQQNVLGNAVQKGAFGGDRSGIAQAELARQQNLSNNATISNLLGQGFTNAQQEFNTQQTTDLANQLQNRNLASQAGINLSNLGINQQNAALQQAQAQYNYGNAQQQQQQANLSTAYQQFLNKNQYPYQQLGYLAQLLSGAAPSLGSTTTQTGAQVNPAQQILGSFGLLNSISNASGGSNPFTSLYNSISNNPLFSTAFKQGGRVGYAEGGVPVSPVTEAYNNYVAVSNDPYASPTALNNAYSNYLESFQHAVAPWDPSYKQTTSPTPISGGTTTTPTTPTVTPVVTPEIIAPGKSTQTGTVNNTKPTAQDAVYSPDFTSSNGPVGTKDPSGVYGYGPYYNGGGPGDTFNSGATPGGGLIGGILGGLVAGPIGALIGSQAGQYNPNAKNVNTTPYDPNYTGVVSQAPVESEAAKVASNTPPAETPTTLSDGLTAETRAAREVSQLQDPLANGADLASKAGSTPTAMGLVGADMQKNNQISAAVAAIGKIESGGNYAAIGPTTTSGDNAYGKYQVMGANIPAWTKEVLGVSMTPQQFLADQNAQDAVAQAKISQYAGQDGNVQSAAAQWFTGTPLANVDPNAKDILGTTVPAYLQKFNSAYQTEINRIVNPPLPPENPNIAGVVQNVISESPTGVVPSQSPGALDPAQQQQQQEEENKNAVSGILATPAPSLPSTIAMDPAQQKQAQLDAAKEEQDRQQAIATTLAAAGIDTSSQPNTSATGVVSTSDASSQPTTATTGLIPTTTTDPTTIGNGQGNITGISNTDTSTDTSGDTSGDTSTVTKITPTTNTDSSDKDEKRGGRIHKAAAGGIAPISMQYGLQTEEDLQNLAEDIAGSGQGGFSAQAQALASKGLIPSSGSKRGGRIHKDGGGLISPNLSGFGGGSSTPQSDFNYISAGNDDLNDEVSMPNTDSKGRKLDKFGNPIPTVSVIPADASYIDQNGKAVIKEDTGGPKTIDMQGGASSVIDNASKIAKQIALGGADASNYSNEQKPAAVFAGEYITVPDYDAMGNVTGSHREPVGAIGSGRGAVEKPGERAAAITPTPKKTEVVIPDYAKTDEGPAPAPVSGPVQVAENINPNVMSDVPRQKYVSALGPTYQAEAPSDPRDMANLKFWATIAGTPGGIGYGLMAAGNAYANELTDQKDRQRQMMEAQARALQSTAGATSSFATASKTGSEEELARIKFDPMGGDPYYLTGDPTNPQIKRIHIDKAPIAGAGTAASTVAGNIPQNKPISPISISDQLEADADPVLNKYATKIRSEVGDSAIWNPEIATGLRKKFSDDQADASSAAKAANASLGDAKTMAKALVKVQGGGWGNQGALGEFTNGIKNYVNSTAQTFGVNAPGYTSNDTVSAMQELDKIRRFMANQQVGTITHQAAEKSVSATQDALPNIAQQPEAANTVFAGVMRQNVLARDYQRTVNAYRGKTNGTADNVQQAFAEAYSPQRYNEEQNIVQDLMDPRLVWTDPKSGNRVNLVTQLMDGKISPNVFDKAVSEMYGKDNPDAKHLSRWFTVQ